jgi:hypothetical protein
MQEDAVGSLSQSVVEEDITILAKLRFCLDYCHICKQFKVRE